MSLVSRCPRRRRIAARSWPFALLAGLCGALSLVSPQVAQAQPVYLAPPKSQPAGRGDGSQARPFMRIKAALAAIEAGQGDHILLHNGHYGNAYWEGIRPAKPLRIAPAPGAFVHFDSLTLRYVENLQFSGFHIWPRKVLPKPIPMVSAGPKSKNLSFDRFDLRARKDALQNYRRWSVAEWRKVGYVRGFLLKSPNTVVRNSTISATSYAVEVWGNRSKVVDNKILGFSHDGLRGLGNNSEFRGNLVQDCVFLNKNIHMDGFQSWSPKNNGADSTISNVVIEENQFWEWKGPEAPTLPCRLQGIGLFDGFYKDFRIRNNLVVVSHYHGISIYGAINSVIANNTVVRPQGQPGKSPWISVQTHKRGDPSKNTRVFNNVAMSYKDIANALRANAVVRYPAQAFVAPAQGDFTPLPDGPLVDRAVGPSPARDLIGISRPQGKKGDLGALEAPL